MMRSRVLLHIQRIMSETGGTSIETEHILCAISRAHADHVDFDSASPSDTLQESIKAYGEGDWISSQEWLDELRSQVSTTC